MSGYNDYNELEGKEGEIRRSRLITWSKKGYEQLYGSGSYERHKKLLFTAETGEF